MTAALQQYTYRQSILTKPWHFSLDDQSLIWHDEARPSPVALNFEHIAEVQPKFDPTRVQLNRYLLQIKTRKGHTVQIASMTYKGISDFEDQAASYAAFVQALHSKLAAANPTVKYVKGISTLGYVMSMMVLVFLILLFVAGGAMMLSGIMHPVIIVKFILLLYFIPTLWRYIKRNKPGAYDPLNLPADILPQA